MVVGSTSVNKASPVGWDKAEVGQAALTRALQTRNSMSELDVVRLAPSQPAAGSQLVPAASPAWPWRPSLT